VIIVCGGIKGGSGKSTVATNLAVMRALGGHDVMLVDADDQETSADFTTYRNERTDGKAGYTCIRLSGPSVRTEILRLREKCSDIVVDTGGRDTTSQRAALSVAELVLVPFVPRSFDVWTLNKVAQLVDEMRTANPELLAAVFLNRADPSGRDNAEAAELLGESPVFEFWDTPLGSRKAFANAAATGQAVVELTPADTKAAREVTTLFQRSFDVNITSIQRRKGA
jgi:chromosome partitioning protein